MSKTKISQYFNPQQHLVFHQDKHGNMIGGGYQINNLLYQHKMPLFVSMSGGSAGASAGADACHNSGDENPHFIPEKFSDLFKDLAIPAGLFMMPSLFKPRNYAFEVPEEEPNTKTHHDDDDDDDNNDDDTDSDDTYIESDQHKTKPVPNDIFDTLLSLVEPKDRIQHDVKTRRHRRTDGGGGGSGRRKENEKNKTRRMRS